MKITGLRTLTSLQDWGRPVGDVNGFVDDGITEVPLVVVETDGGLEGIGIGSHTDVERVFPAIVGQDPRATSALYDQMLAHVFKSGHAGATFGGIGALDMALWDLKAKMAEEPLWRTLGAADRFIPGYASALEIAAPDDGLEELYAGWVARGFTSVKVKGGRDLGRDLARLTRVRDIFRANTKQPALMLDANESWNKKQAIRHICALEREIDLAWVEEPLRRWDADGMAMVSRAVRAAVATGENLTGLEQFKPLLDAGAVDIVQTGSMWGITHFLRIATVAHSRDLPISPVGSTASPVWHAAAAVPNHLAAELQDLGSPLGVHSPHEITDGGVVLSDDPGHGLSIDEAVIAQTQLGQERASSSGPHVRPSRAGLRLVPEDADPGRLDESGR
ncbi:MAG: mandelate racemase/muconate lactonizing enzyme family protein [Actinomycetes bacterium]